MKSNLMNHPEKYDQWYQTTNGAWIGELEFLLLQQLIQAPKNSSLLDVGCGSGYFSRRFAGEEMRVSAMDCDAAMINFSRAQSTDIQYFLADALYLPFKTAEFDYTSAITSLCFIDNYQLALAEMWRVSNKAMLLGLLNSHSLLYLQKANRGQYQGARWDSPEDVRQWLLELTPTPSQVILKSVLFVPGLGVISRKIEALINNKLPLGGFLAVYVQH